MRRLTVSLLAALLFTWLACAACSGPPLKERQQADDAIAAARAAGAATYAPADLRAAEASLKAYDDAVAQHDFRRALSSALDARDHGYAAMQTAADQKAALTARREALLTDTKALVSTAQAHLAAGKSSRGAADRLRQSIRAATTAMQEAGAVSAKDDLKGALSRLVSASDGLRKELAAFDAGGKPAKRTPTSG